MMVFDICGSPPKTTEAYHQVNSWATAIVGNTRSSCCEPLAVSTTLDGLPAMSYSSTAAKLARARVSLTNAFHPLDTRTPAMVKRHLFGVGAWQSCTSTIPTANRTAKRMHQECSALGMVCESSSYSQFVPSTATLGINFLAACTIFFAIAFDEDLDMILDASIEAGVIGPGRALLFADAVTQAKVAPLDAKRADAIQGCGLFLQYRIVYPAYEYLCVSQPHGQYRRLRPTRRALGRRAVDVQSSGLCL